MIHIERITNVEVVDVRFREVLGGEKIFVVLVDCIPYKAFSSQYTATTCIHQMMKRKKYKNCILTVQRIELWD